MTSITITEMSECISTQSAEALWYERIAGLLTGEKPPKMQFWRLKRSMMFANYQACAIWGDTIRTDRS